jgi:hypothetical protein
LALLHQALIRDGQVIWPVTLGSDFVQTNGRVEGDEEWMPKETPISQSNYHE